MIRIAALLVIAACGDAGTTRVIVAAGPGTVHLAWRRPSPPPKPASSAPVTGLSAMGHHACARHADGAVSCWGEDVENPLDRRMLRSSPVGAPIGDALEVATGADRTCVRRKDGVWCWGAGSVQPEHIAGVDDAVEITARCARNPRGEVRCWHDLLAADLEPRWIDVVDLAGAEDRTCVIRSGAVTCWNFAASYESDTQVVAGAVEVATSLVQTCARSSEGAVMCWWAGETESTTAARMINNVEHATQVVVGPTYACELERTGEVRCWGRAPDAFGVERAYAEVVPGVRADELVAGDEFMCARTGAEVRCWGENDQGQLGTGWSRLHPDPIAVPEIDDAVDVHAGGTFTCARRRSGRVACWGSGYFTEGPLPADVPDMADAIQLTGMLDLCARFTGGQARCKSYGPPVQVAVTTADLSVAADHGIAVHADGGLSGWGDEGYGAIGVRIAGRLTEHRGGSDADVEIKDAVAVAAAETSSCFIRRDRTVACVGRVPAIEPVAYPAAVPGIDRAVALALGRQFGCALIADGTVRCWGENQRGALGLDTQRSSERGVAIRGLDHVVQLAAAVETICARRDDGTVWCWGDNNTGILGDPFELPWSAEPVQIPLAKVVDIGVSNHACAVLATGAVWCWGLAEDGQVGTIKSKSLGPSRVRFTR